MIAIYDGTCSDCGGRIHIGDEIVAHTVGWGHVECPRVPQFDVQPGEIQCGKCFLIHREGACDL